MKLKFLLLSLIIALMLGGCSSSDEGNTAASSAEELKADAEFVAAVEALTSTTLGMPAPVNSLDELITSTKPNLIVRATCAGRGASVESGGAVTTPYLFTINEVYLGDLYSAGEMLTFNAEYGITDTASFRSSPYPILKLDGEYLLFMRIDDIYGEMYCYFASNLYGAVTLNGSEFSLTTGADSFFDDYADTDAMIADLKALIAKNNYPTEPTVIS